jgi:hypothetical protein
MPEILVDDIKINAIDATGARITTVYAKKPREYAVYRTPERVVVQYADAPAQQNEQRTNLAGLNPLRGEINGLINGWRSSTKPHLLSNASRFDRRVADAVMVALENDRDSAHAVLVAIKGDIVDIRTSWARLQYLMVATGSFLLFGVVALLLRQFASNALLHAPYGKSLIFGAVAGGLGAFFSVAIGMKDRTILTDLHFWNNAADAALRVVIGVIAGGLLVALTQTKLVTTALTTADMRGPSWLYVLLIGVVAGFAERLVPDILAKSAAATNLAAASAAAGAPPVRRPAGAAGAAVGTAGVAAGVAPAAAPIPSLAPQAAVIAAPHDPDEHEDACLCDIHTGAATPDTELPPAIGGVAAPRPGS